MTSHEWARKTIAMAEWLLSKPEFETPRVNTVYETFDYYSDKNGFLAAVKAIGGIKRIPTESWREGEYHLVTEKPDFEVRLTIKRSSVCRMVEPAREAVYECEPLLTAKEEQSIEMEMK